MRTHSHALLFIVPTEFSCSRVAPPRFDCSNPPKMCFPTEPPAKNDTGDMGFDAAMLKNVLEQFVDEIAEESSDLIADRPRFAHAVVVLTDDEGELCQASCIRQLDVIVHETTNAFVDSEWEDEEIQRALRSLSESRELLGTPRQSLFVDDNANPSVTSSVKEVTTSVSTSRATRIERNFDFPSMSRVRTTPSHN
ncbi:unnamed protein product [Caenorhabditis auriculariae]|uniref:Uncharacterized protein n=1 Tax=Caenorhabditis auriculariae TaxID=2777116 RepID=A0A8S1HNY9_9PELO|nr:unnamed protein product [Caenorhabditis auriculariae]